MPGLIALADDLSGAAETAVALMSGSVGACVALRAGGCAEGSGLCVVDLDSRHCAAAEAARRVRAAAGDAPVVFKKIDSLLRGNVAAEVQALVAGDVPVIVAPALPVLGRTVAGGVVRLGGVPLADTDAWEVEGAPAPPSLPALLGHAGAAADLGAVRSGRLDFGPGLTLCDAETDADLDAIAAAAARLDRVRLVGSAGLAAAVGRRLGRAPLPPLPPAAGNDVLVVVGTAAPAAATQLARLGAPEGVRVLRCHGPGQLPRLAREAAAAGRVDLVLTGGETARAVLDALGVAELRPLGQIHHGAVLSLTGDGRRVVTRPGSFGGPDSLLEIVRALRPAGERGKLVT